jgi:membrane-associated phospholipid phosphatase
MENRIARILSVLFHPLLIPTYALLILVNTKTHFTLILPENFRYMTVLFVFLTSFVLPLLLILILLKLGKVKSLEMEDRRERILPLFIVAIFFYMTYYLLKQGPHFAIFNVFMLGATLLVIMSMLVNYITKISIHMVALGGLLGTFIGFALALRLDLRMLLSSIIIIAGLTGFARLQLKAHTPGQVYAGFLMGVIFMFGLFLFI